MLYVRALRFLGTARTGACFAVAPFVGSVLSLFVWRDPITTALVGAGAFMGVGVWLHTSERHIHEHVHDALVHDHAHVHDEHHQHAHSSRDQFVTALFRIGIGTNMSRSCTRIRIIRIFTTDTSTTDSRDVRPDFRAHW